MVLTYYSPYVSGLTETARCVAEQLAARGWEVTVLATGHDAALSAFEVLNGVKVHRARAVAHVGKGVISVSLPMLFRRLARAADVINMHVPMAESGALVSLTGVPVVVTYYCDMNLPPGLVNRVTTFLMDRSAGRALRCSTHQVATTRAYADSCRQRNVLRSAVAIPPPCRLREGGSPSFRETAGLHVGFIGRIVAEKGVDVLVRSFRRIDDPDARLQIAGD